MDKVNLLPWRQEWRQKQRRRFIQISSLALVFLSALFALLGFRWQSAINELHQNNAQLELVVTNIYQQGEEAKERQNQIEQLQHQIERQQLNNTRSLALLLALSPLVQFVPHRIRINTVSFESSRILLEGQTDHAQHIQALQGALTTSACFVDVELYSIKQLNDGSGGEQFKISYQVATAMLDVCMEEWLSDEVRHD
ncbi:PilN domain-containing protein [Vibrio hippocampi]|uniref:Pilus assembly protein PilN n=1 Tax=Vibrio hippocampi TaxID=654686 RepID=A0ABM8ZE82_9VIBR|nr:PilN domain-containing protein [Vibrio hippocampi]CAH0524547.1 hypothetical protein VHP8226_00385 [Vibrio hippocampi]